MSIEDLEKELYSPEGPEERESRYKRLKRLQRSAEKTARQPASPDEAWGSALNKTVAQKKKGKKRKKVRLERSPLPAKKILGFFIVALLAGSGIMIYSYFSQFNDSRSVRLDIDGPAEVLLGVPFELKVNFRNELKTKLQSAQIDLVLPAGISAIGYPNQSIVSKNIESVSADELVQEPFQLVALEDEKTAKEITAIVKYSVKSISSRFSKEKRFIVNVGEPGLRLDVVFPNKVLSGEEFNVDFSIHNVSQTSFEDVSLVLNYPETFEYLGASEEPFDEENTWALGSIGSNAPSKVTLLGRVFGKDGSFFSVTGDLIINYQGQKITISSKSASFAIAPSPLSVNIVLNESKDYVATPGDALNYTISYTNNTDIGLKDVVVKARLLGEMFDIPTLQTKAFFESINNTVTWNAASIPELRLVPAGASGKVRFSIATKGKYPSQRLSDKNFTLKTTAVVESPTVPFFVASEKTTGIADIETKIVGNISVQAYALFRDAASGILNSGPFPPKVNTPTNYTVHWVVSGEATDISNIEIRAFLQSGVRWTGEVKSDLGNSVPSYNERTSELVWFINKIHANRGIVDDPIEATFQIEAIPSVLQIGKYMPLVGRTQTTAIDTFTASNLTSASPEITSQLTKDITIVDKQQGQVLP